MLFFFGIGKSKLKNEHLLKNSVCPHCNNENTLVSQTYAKYFHFFFIPMFPVSKEAIATCSHCKIHLEESKFSEQMRDSYNSQEAINPNKRPIWQGCGCIVILVLFVIPMLFSGLYALFTSSSSDKKTESVSQVDYYLQDLDSLTVSPKSKNDTVSLIAKDCLDASLDGIVNTSEIKYFSKVKGDKVLIIVKISDIKKIKSTSRKEILTYIKQCLSMFDGYEGKKLYIAVEGQWNTVLISSPNETDDGGKFANTKLLDDFYKDSAPTMDTLIIKKDKKDLKK